MSLSPQKKQRTFNDPDTCRKPGDDQTLFMIGVAIGIILWGITVVYYHGLQSLSLFQIVLCPVLAFFTGLAAVFGYTLWSDGIK